MIRKIRDLRQDMDLTQRQIADFLHIAQSTYSDYENKKIAIPIDILVKLAKFYNVSIDYLIGNSKKRTHCESCKYYLYYKQNHK